MSEKPVRRQVPKEQTGFHLGAYESEICFEGLHIENKTDKGVTIKVYRTSELVKSPSSGDIVIQLVQLTE